MKKFLLLFSAVLLTFAGCSDSSTSDAVPYNHWKYGNIETPITLCRLISYGDTEGNGTYCYEFILSSGEIDEENFLHFKLCSSTEELADGVYAIDPTDSQGLLTEAGYRNLTVVEPVSFTTGSIEIRKFGEDSYNITFSFKDGRGVVHSGYYDGELEFLDQTPDPGIPLEVSNVLFDENDRIEFSELTKVSLVLGSGDSETVLGTGILAGGGFSLILPRSIGSSLLKDAHDVWNSGLTFSSERGTVRQSNDIHIYGYKLDRRMGEFIISDPDIQYPIIYMYSDGNITVRGNYEEEGLENIYDLTLVKGWNMIYYYYDFSAGAKQRVTTDIPNAVAWIYISNN